MDVYFVPTMAQEGSKIVPYDKAQHAMLARTFLCFGHETIIIGPQKAGTTLVGDYLMNRRRNNLMQELPEIRRHAFCAAGNIDHGIITAWESWTRKLIITSETRQKIAQALALEDGSIEPLSTP